MIFDVLEVELTDLYLIGKDLFSFDNWPVPTRSRLLKDEFSQLKESEYFQLSPLPLFDANGGLVPPKDYVRVLTGALVTVDVTLSNGDGGFSANVDHIQLLRAPLPLEMSLTKRQCPTE